MEKIVTIDKISKLDDYQVFDSFLIVNKFYSCFRKDGLCNRNSLRMISLIHERKKKAYVLLDRVMFNEDLENLKVFLYQLEAKGCDGYFFSDLGVMKLLEEMEIIHKGYFYSQTQIVSTLELKSYLEYKVKTVFVSKDLPINDIIKVSSNLSLGVNVYGYRNLFYSRRKLLSSYKEEYSLKDKFAKSDKYKIRELKREAKSIIYEDDYGTYVFTSYIDNHINHLVLLDENKVEYVLFDDNFVSKEEFIKVIEYLENPKGLFTLSSKEVDTYVQ